MDRHFRGRTDQKVHSFCRLLNGGTSTKGKKMYSFCLDSYCHVGELSFFLDFGIDYNIYQRAGEPTFILNDNLFLIIHGRMRSGG